MRLRDAMKIIYLSVLILFLLDVNVSHGSHIEIEKNSEAQWPMYQHDSRYSGRSPFSTKPNAGKILWKTQIASGHSIHGGDSIVIDSQGNVYFYAGDEYLYSVAPNGTLRWKIHILTDSFISGPVIGANDIIYIKTNPGIPPPNSNFVGIPYFYAISSNGSVRYDIKMNITTSPTVDDDGIVYFGAKDGIYKVNPNSSIEKYTDIIRNISISISIGPNNTMYLVNESGIFALSRDLKILWKIPRNRYIADRIVVDPTVGIYVPYITDGLSAYNLDGSLRWHIQLGGIEAYLAVGKSHVLYYITSGTLYAINPQNGKYLWHVEIGGYWYTSPVIGGDGTIYVGNGWPENDTGYLYAVNPNGKVRWKIKTDGAIITPPAISKNGTLYVGTSNGTLYAIGGYVNESPENTSNLWLYYSVGIGIGIGAIAGVAAIYHFRRKKQK